MSNNVQVQITGLAELARDIEHAANLAPLEFQRGMKEITKKFMDDLKDEADNAYSTTKNITSGFKMSPVNVANDVLWSYFMPEAKGNKNHHWHLNEFGHELLRPTWKSRRLVIRYQNGGERLGFVPGKHLVDKMLPGFEDYMDEAVMELVDSILEENNL